jgi:uncharacterized membrane protein
LNQPSEPHFDWRDLAEVGIGSCMIAFPFAATEETWNLGAEMSLGRLLVFATASICLLAVCIYFFHRHEGHPVTHKAFLLRVVGTYGVAFLISGLMLLSIDRLDLLQDPLIALKRTVFVAFPASFAATTVDGLADRS